MRYNRNTKKISIIACFLFIVNLQAYSQTDFVADDWKNKRLYTSAWAGYGSGFAMGLCADAQLYERFALGVELGLVDKSYPALSILPKYNFRPLKMEVGLYGGLGFGYSTTYDFIWGVKYGVDLGYKIGTGVMFVRVDNGLGWSLGIGYRIGFLKNDKMSSK